jgi:outer membrane immunogenic protein
MKRVIIAAALFATGAIPAIAADMPVKARPAPVEAVVFNWTGFYVGVHGGFGTSWADRDTGAFQNSYRLNGVLAGGQAGFNYQINRIVFGVGADGAWSDIEGSDGGVGGTVDTTKFRWLTTVHGRLGLAWDRFLVYAIGGWAWTSARHTNPGGNPISVDHKLDGWMAGGGVEAAIINNLSLAGEYRTYDFGSYAETVAGLAAFTINTRRVHSFTTRLNYRFSIGGF